MLVLGSEEWAMSLSGAPTWQRLFPVGSRSPYSGTIIFDTARDRVVQHDSRVWELGFSIPVAVGEPRPPETLELDRIFPNPTVTDPTIRFTLPRGARMNLSIYDLAGRSIRELVRGDRAAGPHRVVWNRRTASGVRVAPGVYLCVLCVGDSRVTRRFVVT